MTEAQIAATQRQLARTRKQAALHEECALFWEKHGMPVLAGESLEGAIRE